MATTGRATCPPNPESNCRRRQFVLSSARPLKQSGLRHNADVGPFMLLLVHSAHTINITSSEKKAATTHQHLFTATGGTNCHQEMISLRTGQVWVCTLHLRSRWAEPFAFINSSTAVFCMWAHNMTSDQFESPECRSRDISFRRPQWGKLQFEVT